MMSGVEGSIRTCLSQALNKRTHAETHTGGGLCSRIWAGFHEASWWWTCHLLAFHFHLPSLLHFLPTCNSESAAPFILLLEYLLFFIPLKLLDSKVVDEMLVVNLLKPFHLAYTIILPWIFGEFSFYLPEFKGICLQKIVHKPLYQLIL